MIRSQPITRAQFKEGMFAVLNNSLVQKVQSNQPEKGMVKLALGLWVPHHHVAYLCDTRAEADRASELMGQLADNIKALREKTHEQILQNS